MKKGIMTRRTGNVPENDLPEGKKIVAAVIEGELQTGAEVDHDAVGQMIRLSLEAEVAEEIGEVPVNQVLLQDQKGKEEPQAANPP